MKTNVQAILMEKLTVEQLQCTRPLCIKSLTREERNEFARTFDEDAGDAIARRFFSRN